MLYPTLIFLFALVLFYLLLGGALLVDAVRRAGRARSRISAATASSASLGETPPAGKAGRRRWFTVGPA
jgi:hypothetical protein